jgi:cell division protein FtsW (lipid II flippase)
MGMKALHIRTQYGFYMALAVLGLLGAKFLVSILAGVGLLAGGITGMPFVSYGAADCLIHMASLGLFLSVLRTDGYLQESIQSSSGGRIIKLEDGQLIISLHTRRNK